MWIDKKTFPAVAVGRLMQEWKWTIDKCSISWACVVHE